VPRDRAIYAKGKAPPERAGLSFGRRLGRGTGKAGSIRVPNVRRRRQVAARSLGKIEAASGAELPPAPAIRDSTRRSGAEAAAGRRHRAGRFLGSIVERDGGFRATRLVEGELRSQRFNDRDTAARWLAKLMPAD
jgi:hypothetical protein